MESLLENSLVSKKIPSDVERMGAAGSGIASTWRTRSAIRGLLGSTVAIRNQGGYRHPAAR